MQDTPPNDWSRKTGGRKFIATMTAVTTTTVLTWFDKLDGSIYSLVIIAVIGGYLTSNVVQAKS